MNFNFELSNLGNIKNATVQIKPFTIIAGENSSGKSFITKSLYSVLDALNKNYVENELLSTIHKIKINFDRFYDTFTHIAQVDKEFIEFFYSVDMILFDNVLSIYDESEHNMKENLPRDLMNIKKNIEEYLAKRGSLVKFNNKIKYLKQYIKYIDSLVYILENKKQIIINGIEKNLTDNIKKNYQITSFQNIVNGNQKTKSIKLEMDTIGNISIDKNSALDFSFNLNGIEEIQKLTNIVYLDSPVYTKIRKGLQKQDFSHPFYQKDRYLKDYPLYVENLYKFIDQKYIDEADFHNLSDEISMLIDGNLVVTKSGDIEYVQKDGVSIALSLTAMGISNIGLIELLLKNNIINKGSFLIIDEPEAHLHPKWQVDLVNILYRVAQAGANVIVATHSIDMIKAVEVILNKDADAEKLIALNKMPFDKNFIELDDNEKVEEILSDLSSPFYDLYMANL